MAIDAETALWTRVVGDDWRFSFTTTDDVTTWDEATVVIEVRAGTNADATLVASTEDVSVAAITVTADFTAGELAWHIDHLDTAGIAAGDYTLEVQVEVDGDVTTVLTHSLSVVDEVAVEGA